MIFENNGSFSSNPLADYLQQASTSGADYFSTPYSYGGQQADGKLDYFQMGQLADRVSSGADYTSTLLSLLGDGIGTGATAALDGSAGSGSVFDLGSGGYSTAGASARSNSSGSSGGTAGLNPYLTQAQHAITQQVTDNLQRNIMPGISSAAIASGNYGGSRQGVVEANALKDANQQITNGMANLSFNAYNNAAANDLQQQSINNSYNLGLGNLALGNTTADNNFYTAQRSQDLQSTALGAQLMNQGNTGYLNQGQGVYNVGNTYQQAPWTTVGSFNSSLTPWGNQTGSVTGNQSSNPWASAIGGAIGGAQLYNNWSNSGSSAPVSGVISNLPGMYVVN